jgi:hypothetical protein
MGYEFDFLKSLALTISIETIVLIIIAQTILKKKQLSVGLLILTGFTASFATLPYLWFILPVFVQSKVLYNLVSETTAIIIESFIIWGMLRIKLPAAALISLICNMLSYLVGLIVS